MASNKTTITINNYATINIYTGDGKVEVHKASSQGGSASTNQDIQSFNLPETAELEGLVENNPPGPDTLDQDTVLKPPANEE